MRNIELHDGYVLHRRPYRERSLLVDLFTPACGRLRVVARRARKSGAKSGAAHSGLLEPFRQLQLAWSGRGALRTLTHVEPAGKLLVFEPSATWCGFYINELMMRLLMPFDQQVTLFRAYQDVLYQLAESCVLEPSLRVFEKRLLDELGYGLNLEVDCHSGQPLLPDKRYLFIADEGFFEVPAHASHSVRREDFSGASLIALKAGEFPNREALHDAKRIMRMALAPQLGDKPLNSRRYFLKPGQMQA